ncbi:MAG: 30S ribosomal protein S7 [Thermoplasmata archaeon]
MKEEKEKKPSEDAVDAPKDKVEGGEKSAQKPIEQKEQLAVEKKIFAEMPLLFGKYSFSDITVSDPSFARYLNITPLIVPHTSAKFANRRFGKAKVNIVERLINGMMRTEHVTGEKARTYRLVKQAFEIIEQKTKQNPLVIFINALQRAAPREEVIRLTYGGISVPKAVDVAPSRRLDTALRNICKGTIKSSHGNKKRIEMCLADEIILASKNDMSSFAISKKDEIERVAASAR